MSFNRLYVFAIGGSGVRTLKALCYLLASGIELPAQQIVPIIIDPDRSNGDLTRTIETLRLYQEIRRRRQGEKTSFFQTEITSVTQLANGADSSEQISENNFLMDLDGVSQERFETFLECSELPLPTRNLIELLFTRENLQADLKVGFKGHPNMGSIVLNQFARSKTFRDFGGIYHSDDRIMILSSIFGGTGAAGFPLLVKNIRQASQNLEGGKFLQDARIGALSILPYFGIKPDSKSAIDGSTFIGKTKAALDYYRENIMGNGSINMLYTIADKIKHNYPNFEGAGEQQNSAHLVEFCSALAILDYSLIPDHQLASTNSKANRFEHREFGIEEDQNPVGWKLFSTEDRFRIAGPVTSFYFWYRYVKDRQSSAHKQPWFNDAGLDRRMLQNPFFSNYLPAFFSGFEDWLTEMATNERALALYEPATGATDLFDSVIGYTPQKPRFRRRWNYELFDHTLNKKAREGLKLSTESRYMSLFSQSTFQLSHELFQF